MVDDKRELVLAALGAFEGEAAHLGTTQDVQVQMADGCCAVGAGVDDGAITGFIHTLCLGDFGDYLQQVRQNIFGDVVLQVVEVLLGNNQGVDRCFGLDVIEGVADVVFVDLLGRDFSCDELAEQSISHG